MFLGVLLPVNVISSGMTFGYCCVVLNSETVVLYWYVKEAELSSSSPKPV